MVFSGSSSDRLNGQDAGIRVIPRPAEATSGAGAFEVTGGVSILLCRGTGEQDRVACRAMNEWLEDLGFSPLPVEKYSTSISDSAAPLGKILLGPPAPGSTLGDEGYVITISQERVVATAPTEAGRFYALMTLAQLFRRAGNGVSLPGVVIRDAPALGLRGISDDISRGQVSTLEDMKTIIRNLARYKMNVYMPYLEDMFAFESHPDFGAGRGALTRRDVEELEQFAGDHHVRIIPIFQTLGHNENLLLQDKYRHLAEFPGAACLSPAEPRVYTFLQEVLSEIVPAFSDRYFHIGCDESWDIGRGKCRALNRRIGLAEIHARHYRKVYDIVTGMGRKVMMYGDIILKNPDILDKLPDDMVVVDWHYNAAREYPSVGKFRRAGLDVVVSPGVANWNCLYPHYARALTNIEYLTREGFEQGALGAVTSNWGDNGALCFRQLNYWGYAFAAACAWNPNSVDRVGLERDFWRQFLSVEDPGPWLEINRLLTTLGRGLVLYDWWRYPLLEPSKNGGTGKTRDPGPRGRAIKAGMVRARDLIAGNREAVSANRWFVDLADLVARMGEVMADKYLWQEEYFNSGRDKGFSAARKRSLEEKAEKLRKAFAAIKGQYGKFWTLFNKPQGLEWNVLLFDRQLTYWDEIIDSLRAGNRPVAHTLDKGWITPAGTVAKGRLRKERTCWFRTTFDCDPATLRKVDRALFQIMGMYLCRAYLNGESVGETIGQRTLSLIVEHSRAKVLDLTGKLRPGQNTLALAVTNQVGRTPGINLYAELLSPGGEVLQKVVSGTGWRGIESDTEPAGWTGHNYDHSAWSACENFSVGLPVSAPFLAKGINSRIER